MKLMDKEVNAAKTAYNILPGTYTRNVQRKYKSGPFGAANVPDGLNLKQVSPWEYRIKD